MLLLNGSHRAYAVRDSGISHAPCLVQQVTRREELEVTAVSELVQRPDDFLVAPRPPLLKDYFDPLLRMDVQVPKTVRQVRVVVSVETLDAPAA